MPDDAMFAPLRQESGTAMCTEAEIKPVPIVPVPTGSPECRWRHREHGTPVAMWPYQDAEGQLVGYSARVEFHDEHGARRKEVLPVTYCRIDGGRCAWRAAALPAPRLLYRLPELIADLAMPVIVTEGEKCADRVSELFPGYLGTTSMGGAHAARQADWAPLAGRKVIIWPDNDEPGRSYAKDVAALATLAGATSVAIVPVPAEWPRGWDIADSLPEGVEPEKLAELLHSAIPWESATSSKPRDEADASAANRAKPQLVIRDGDLPATVRELRQLFAADGNLYDRDMPVKLVQPATGEAMIAKPLTVNTVVIEAHRVCQPVKLNSKQEGCEVTLPDRVARMYLDMHGEWDLPPLDGISTAPLLASNGDIRHAIGYEPTRRLWCCRVPPLTVPPRPGRAEAATALRLLRETFRSFPFADAQRHYDRKLGVDITDIDQPPGRDESAFLAALLTAICRPSLWLAPGFLVVAPQVSGAGTGKGLLVRAICLIAFGSRPRAFTAGHDRQELDKRLAAEFVEATPAIFLDNMNGAILRSDTLAALLTERPARVRVLGQTRMVALNSTAFIAITGNGLRISEDLARRFLLCELDAHCEDPESRDFRPGFLKEIEARRAELLSAALTIWRYGRQDASELQRGRPLGSFEDWCAWVRDPLLSLGCHDPVERIELVKAQDPHRQHIAELFRTWDQCHGASPVRAAELSERVLSILDPQRHGRQYVAARLAGLAGARSAGFVLTRQEASGKWSAATYALGHTDPEGGDGIGHRDHRDHRPAVPPMPPMRDGPDGETRLSNPAAPHHLESDDLYQERAALIEYDGGYSRPEAEQRARTELSSRQRGWLQ